MKNVTLSLDEETYRRARIVAAQQGTSVSGLVKQVLVKLGSGQSEAERLREEERGLRERITAFRASTRLSREDAHGRGS